MNRALELAETLDSIMTNSLSDGSNLSTVWANHFGVEESSPQLALALSALHEKFLIAKAEVVGLKVTERTRGLYNRALDTLVHTVRPPFPYSQQKKWLSQNKTQVDILFMAGETFPSYLVPDVNPKTVESLKAEIEQLKKSVSEGSFDGGLRKLIISSLDTLLMAIQSYSSLGPDGAARVYGAAAAELARIYSSGAPKSASEKTAFQKAVKLCKKVGGAIIFAHAVVSGASGLIDDGSDLLGLEELVADADKSKPDDAAATSEPKSENETSDLSEVEGKSGEG